MPTLAYQAHASLASLPRACYGRVMDDTPLTLEDLGLLATVPSARGRRPAPLQLEYVRDIDASDASALLAPAPKGSTTPSVLTLRNTHHQLARLLASGIKQAEISLMTGYSQSRISILKNDPAFAELIEYYKTQTEQRYLDIHEKLATVGTAVVEELAERVEDGKLTNRELMEFGEFCLDRSLTPQGRTQPTGGAGVAIAINFVKPDSKPSDPVGGVVIDVEADKQP